MPIPNAAALSGQSKITMDESIVRALIVYYCYKVEAEPDREVADGWRRPAGLDGLGFESAGD
jgi:hypothetical protein